MKGRNRIKSTLLALVLSLSMIITYLPTSMIAYATDEGDNEPTVEMNVDNEVDINADDPQDIDGEPADESDPVITTDVENTETGETAVPESEEADGEKLQPEPSEQPVETDVEESVEEEPVKGLRTFDDGKTVLAFTSDIHNQGDDVASNRLDAWLKKVEAIHGKVDVMSFCGDMGSASANESQFWTYTQSVMDVVDGYGSDGVYTTGNHEFYNGKYASTSNDVKKEYIVGGVGLNGDNYIIYCLGTTNWDNNSDNYTTEQINALSSFLSNAGKDKPIIILTHFPLHHYGSRTTAKAEQVIDTLNTAAASDKKIVLLWGHNHTLSDTNYDEVFEPGSTIQFGSSASDSKAFNFYYAAAGCMSDTEYGGGGGSTGSVSVKGKGLVITINSKNQLSFTYYDADANNVTEGGTFTEQDPLYPTSISVSPKTLELEVNRSAKLSVGFTPSDTNQKDITWTTSDKNVATVTNGKVKGVSVGTAVITATSADGSCTDTCSVNVIPRSNEETYYVIKIGDYVLSTERSSDKYSSSSGYGYGGSGNTYTGLAAADYSSATSNDEDISWIIEETEDDSGYYIKSLDGRYLNATYTTSSSGSSSTSDLKLDDTPDVWVLDSGVDLDSWELNGSYLKSTNAESRYLSEETGSGGSHLFSVRSKNNADKTTIEDAGSLAAAVNATAIAVSPKTMTVEAGSTKNLTITYTPENTTNKNVTWSSSDPSVATVENGKVTGIAKGTATITATYEDGVLTDTCEVTVTKAAGSGVTPEGGKKYVILASDGYALTSEGDEVGYTNGSSGSEQYHYTGLTGEAYTVGENVFPDRLLWTFTAANRAGTGYYITSNDGRYLNGTYEANASGGYDGTLKLDDTPDIWIVDGTTSGNTVSGGILKSTNASQSDAGDKYLSHGNGDESVANIFSLRSEEHATTTAFYEYADDGTYVSDPDDPTPVDPPTPTDGTNYKLVSQFTSGKDYLIVSSNSAGSGYALTNPGGTKSGASMGSTAVTVKSGDIDGDGTSDIYVSSEETNIVWRATANDSRFNLTNGSDYLEGKSGNVKIFNSQQYGNRGWTYTDSQLQHVGGDNTYTVYYSSSFTSTYNSSSDKIYIYEKVEPVQGDDPVDSVSLNKTALTLTEGDTEQLTATVLPATAGDKSVSWESTNESVATVDETGLVTAVKEGTATITVTTTDGRKKATCAVTVNAPAPVEGDRYEEVTSLEDGKEYIMAVTKDDNSVYAVRSEGGSNKVTASVLDVTEASGDKEAYIITDDAKVVWGYTSSNKYLINDGDYFYPTSSRGVQTYTSGRAIEYANGKLYFESNSSGRYYLTFSDVSFNTTNSESSAANIRLFAKTDGSTPVDPPTPGEGTKYVKTNTLEAGKNYVIASSGTVGNTYILGHDGETAKTYSSSIVSESGALTITTSKADVVFSASEITDGVSLTNGDYYMTVEDSGTLTFSTTSSTKYWSYTNNKLSNASSTTSSTTRYLTFSGNEFKGYYSSSNPNPSDIFLYEEVTNVQEKFTITFVNDDGTVLQSSKVAYGETPVYTGTAPAKAATAQYTYTFEGWTPEITAVTGEATYTATYTSAVNKYTIKFVNEDGTELDTQTVAYGETPVYAGETPTKAATAQYTYTFAGWDKEIVSVTGDATYTATYSSTVNKYTIKFVNEDGTVLQSGKVAYGETPSYTGATPTKAATAQYTYTFDKWTPEITAVTGEATYKATYTSFINEYTIKFVNEDGTELDSQKVAYGETPAYTGATPTKAADAQYTYAFDRWSPAIVAVTGNATYTATYSSTVNKYTVTWKNYDGEVLETDNNVEYGTVPTYDGATPTKPGDAQYKYAFAGWTPTVSEVKGDVVYTALFTEDTNTYTVTWYNSDGTSIEVDQNVAYGAIPEYNGETPTKAADAQYTYTFAGWSPEIRAVTGNAIYIATYTKTLNKYTIKFVNEDGAELQSDEVAYGEMPVYSGATPTKEADAQYTYTFDKWSPAITTVIGNATYKATYSSTVNDYKVKFVDEDGTELQNSKLTYGDTPEYTGTDPTKAATAQYTYTFSGWTPAITAVTGEATYTATYSSKVNEYAIKFVNEDGSVLQTSDVAYGDTPSYTGATPTKAATAQNTYTFAGWTPEIKAVTGEATYKANYTTATRKYTIKFMNSDGTELQSSEVAYGATPEYTGKTPTKAADAQYTYTFDKWSPTIADVTGNATYTATYSSTVNKYTVTWKNYDGTVLETDKNVEYGTVPTYDGATPTKPGDAQYKYAFANWTPTVSEVKGDVVYTALFTEKTDTYSVTWNNSDGTTLKVDKDVKNGTIPSYSGITPTKQGDAQYTYTFAGWSPEVSTVTGNVTYTATYTSTLNKYTVTFVDEDGTTVLDSQTLAYGETPVYGGKVPAKAADAQNTYTFTGWEPAITEVTGNAIYKATYSTAAKDHTISFVNEDGTVLQSSKLAYGETPEYTGTTPTKAADAQYTYTFKGWTPAIKAVTGDATYTATFDKTPSTFTVTWNNYDGKTLKVDKDVAYGTTPKYTGATPTRLADTQNTYTFAGWSPDVSSVTKNVTYTATFKSAARNYGGLLIATMKAVGNTQFTISWTGYNGADGFDIFLAKCNKGKNKYELELVDSVGGGVRSWIVPADLIVSGSNMQPKTAYKAVIKAYIMANGKKEYVKESPDLHAYSSGGDAKYSNAKAIKAGKVTVKVKKTKKIKATATKVFKKKKLIGKGHAPTFRYLSTDPSIATVSAAGKVKGVAKGTCYVYVYTANGVYKMVKVVVK